ncbi:prealbumin-like fold domain-containing protein [Nocardioides convexus]|uniref:prealbumin-like fold domain-containing protein n=1 Tax=Nocardioides convexus TaxID=2712224 RepID=UPI002418B029|nr:prealbumin-like fold domain-containing protein [Nocardioides convexus]
MAGATFALYRETNGANGLQTDSDTLIGTCVTPASGDCVIGDLPFGGYWWKEIAAPTGYGIPGADVVGMIVVNATNAGGPIIPSGLADPQVLSALTVVKRDATTDAEPDGAVFEPAPPGGGRHLDDVRHLHDAGRALHGR